MKKAILTMALAGSMALPGCASQLHMKQQTLDVVGVGPVTAVSIESQNGLSNNLKVIQTFQDGKKSGEYAHGNDGIMYPLLSGAIAAGGQIVASEVLDPDNTAMDQAGFAIAEGGEAVNTNTNSSNAESTSVSVAEATATNTTNNRITNRNINSNNNTNANYNRNDNGDCNHRPHRR